MTFVTGLLYRKADYVIGYCRRRVETLCNLRQLLTNLRTSLRENLDDARGIEEEILKRLKARDARS